MDSLSQLIFSQKRLSDQLEAELDVLYYVCLKLARNASILKVDAKLLVIKYALDIVPQYWILVAF